MTPRSFWAIMIKILGIYIVIQSLIAIPQFLGLVYGLSTQSAEPDSGKIFIIEIVYYIAVIALYGTVLGFCLFKTEFIIDKLKLDQGFSDERFEFNIHRSIILKISVMVVGALLMIDGIPLLIQNTFTAFQKSNTYGGFWKNPSSPYLCIELARVFIGYFLLTCSRMIVNYIELKRKIPAANIANED